MLRHGRKFGQQGPASGLAQTEILVVLALVLILILASMYFFNPGNQEEGAYVPPWRQTNGMLAYRRIEAFRGYLQTFYDQYSTLPGDWRDAGYTNSTKEVIGNADGRIQKNNEEDIKVFRDLYVAGILPEPIYRVRSRPMDYYWMRVEWDDGTTVEGHYARLDGFRTLEALAMDRRFDDGRKSSGDILFFPYEENDEFATLLVKLPLFH